MKLKTILAITLFVIWNSCLSQDVVIATKLDEKNGFKDFKLGDSFSKWEKDLKYIETTSDGEKSYLYTGVLFKELFTVKLEEIELAFLENKLTCITLLTATIKGGETDFVSNDYKTIKNDFNTLFGVAGVEIATDDNSGNILCVWKGKLVGMMLIYNYKGVQKFGEEYAGTGSCSIIIFSLASDENLDDGF